MIRSMHARCNAVQFNWADARNEEKESRIALIGRAARDYVINTKTGRERKRERDVGEYYLELPPLIGVTLLLKRLFIVRGED